MIIEGRTCLVFGSARGIGLAYVEALLQHGANVLFTDILEEEGQAEETRLIKQHGEKRVIFRRADVLSDQDVEAAFKEAKEMLGSVRVVVNNCGLLHEFDWKATMEMNLGSNIRCIDACFKHMGKDKGGQGGAFVCTASIAAMRPQPFFPVYTASKHAVVGLVRSWAVPFHYDSHGIRMNVICPTLVNTQFALQITEQRVVKYEEFLKWYDEFKQQEPLSPGRVADALITILQDDSLNGQAVRVSSAHGVDMATFQEQPIQ